MYRPEILHCMQVSTRVVFAKRISFSCEHFFSFIIINYKFIVTDCHLYRHSMHNTLFIYYQGLVLYSDNKGIAVGEFKAHSKYVKN